MTQTHFGFQHVDIEQKASLVRGVFDSVASKYDIMNDVMSGGLHRLWKRKMAGALQLEPNLALLDVAGGTGDIAMLAEKICPKLAITLCDINTAMLEQGRARARDTNTLTSAKWITGNAQMLPFDDASFDRVSIAFGIRNVTDIPKALAEMHRVLRPGGRFVCLEFSRPALPWLEKAYDAYSFTVIPKLGQWITGSKEPYQYLVESIRQFPEQEVFKGMIEAVGFEQVRYENLTGGVVAMHMGQR